MQNYRIMKDNRKIKHNIWDTCSRTGTPCKICSRIPQKHFSLTPLNHLIDKPVWAMVGFVLSFLAGACTTEHF